MQNENHLVERKLTDLDTELDQRGILQQAQQAQWQAYRYHDQIGWRYPVFSLAGDQVAERWKRSASATGNKYAWLPDKPTGADYYFSSSLRHSVADNDGILYIVNGEPAVLTMLAAGISNVLCWFGESSIPKTLIDDLRGLGVTSVRYIADNDDAGLQAAIKVRKKLTGSGIAFKPLSLAGLVSDKGDVNDLWIAHRFDSDALTASLRDLPALVLPKYRNAAYKPTQRDFDAYGDADWAGLKLAIERALPERRKGKFRCVNPSHADETPSAEFSAQYGYICRSQCDHQTDIQVAEWLGIEWREYLPARPQDSIDNFDAADFDQLTPPFETQVNFITPTPSFSEQIYQQWHTKDGAEYETFTINAPYLTDDNVPSTNDMPLVGIRSAMGSGKTTWLVSIAHRLIADGGRVLVISPYASLSRMLSQKYGIANYSGLHDSDYPAIESLSICAKSLHKAKQCQPFDLIVIDELDQVLAQHTNSLYQRGERRQFWAALTSLMQSAKQSVVTSAHLSRLDLNALHNATGIMPVVIQNENIPEFVPLTMLPKRDVAIGNALSLVERSQDVVFIPCGSNKTAQAMKRMLIDRGIAEGEIGLYIKHTSGGSRAAQFAADPNAEISKLRAFIYTTSFGQGLDYTGACAGVVGIFDNAGITPQAYMQMLMRARHADSYSAFYCASETEGADETLTEAIANEIDKATNPAGIADSSIDKNVSEDFETEFLATQSAFSRLSKRHSIGDLFPELCRWQGFVLQQGKEIASAGIKDAFKAASDHVKALNSDKRKKGNAVASDTERKLRRSRQLEFDDFIGTERRVIESAAGIESVIGQALDDAVHDALVDRNDRNALHWFILCNLPTGVAEYLDDKDEKAGVPLVKRRYYAETVKSIRFVICGLAGISIDNFDADAFQGAVQALAEPIDRSVLAKRYESIAVNPVALSCLLMLRTKVSKNPVTILKGVLRVVGLKLIEVERKRAGAEQRSYALDIEHYNRWRSFFQNRKPAIMENTPIEYFAPVAENEPASKLSIEAVSRGTQFIPDNGDLIDSTSRKRFWAIHSTCTACYLRR